LAKLTDGRNLVRSDVLELPEGWSSERKKNLANLAAQREVNLGEVRVTIPGSNPSSPVSIDNSLDSTVGAIFNFLGREANFIVDGGGENQNVENQECNSKLLQIGRH
jgi:hypothetical protein